MTCIILDRRFEVQALRVVASLALLALVIWLIWPRPTGDEAARRATYDALRPAAVPPLLLGDATSNPTGSLTADGYTFEADLPSVGRVALRGQPGQLALASSTGALLVRGHPASLTTSPTETTIAWQEPGATYTLSVPGQPDATTLQAIAARVAPLPDAARDAFGFGWDTPLLYLVYLPLFVGLFVWTGGRLLARST